MPKVFSKYLIGLLNAIFFLTPLVFAEVPQKIYSKTAIRQLITNLSNQNYRFIAIDYVDYGEEKKGNSEKKLIKINHYYAIKSNSFKEIQFDKFEDLIKLDETKIEKNSLEILLTLYELASIKGQMLLAKKGTSLYFITYDQIHPFKYFSIKETSTLTAKRKSGFNFFLAGVKQVNHPTASQQTGTLALMPSKSFFNGKLWLNFYLGGYLVNDTTGIIPAGEFLIGPSYLIKDYFEIFIHSGINYFSKNSDMSMKNSLGIIYPFKSNFWRLTHLFMSYGMWKTNRKSTSDITLAFRFRL